MDVNGYATGLDGKMGDGKQAFLGDDGKYEIIRVRHRSDFIRGCTGSELYDGYH